MPRCLVCGAQVGRGGAPCRSCGTLQPQRRLGGVVALAVLVAGLLVLSVVAALS
ncbi:hypothetical protein [Brevirhabdus sp.]|uniref:hypothetical protein n=1 Tax=Brevirhabdus sp. TaxID=2004514 RepID=UPI004059A203